MFMWGFFVCFEISNSQDGLKNKSLLVNPLNCVSLQYILCMSKLNSETTFKFISTSTVSVNIFISGSHDMWVNYFVQLFHLYIK